MNNDDAYKLIVGAGLEIFEDPESKTMMIRFKGGGLPVPVPAPFVVIDMLGEDYLMTDAEANAAGKLLIGGMAGKKLIWPSTSDTTAPLKQTLAFYGAQPGIILQSQSGGVQAVVIDATDTSDIVYLAGNYVFLVNSQKRYPKIIEEVAEYTLLPTDIGCELVFVSADPVTLIIDEDMAFLGMNFSVVQYGVEQVSFDGTATLKNIDNHTKTEGQNARVYFSVVQDGEIVFDGRTAA